MRDCPNVLVLGFIFEFSFKIKRTHNIISASQTDKSESFEVLQSPEELD